MLEACFGAGCYWGTEKFFFVDFNKRSPGAVSSGAVGFMGPPSAKAAPTYREVCSGATGHVEVYHLTMGTVAGMEAAQLYEEMVRHFFKFHDPTTQDRQGNDAGTQYASVIYCYSPEQEAIAAKVKLELQQLVDSGKVRYTGNAVTTAILPATVFYKADDEHQSYLTKNPGGYCNHAYRFKDWPY